MKKVGLLGSISLLWIGMSTAGFAADIPVISETHDWTGFYLGANIAYRDGQMTQSCDGACPPDDAGVDGAYLGAQIGYDYQFNSGIVLGAFVLAGLTPPSDSFEVGGIRDFDVQPSYGVLFAGRIGYAIDEFLPYVFGGYGISQVDVDAEYFGPEIPDSDSNTHHGYAIGAGIDWMVLEHVSLGAQYMYSSFEKEEYEFDNRPGAPSFGETANTFAVVMNYRF